MDILIQSYYIILPIVLTALIGWLGVILKNNNKKNKEQEEIRKANSKGTMLILRYMLKRYHSEYVIQGKITYSQYKDWIDIYSAYKALGGNSIAEEWNEEVEAMKKCDSIDGFSPFEAMLRQSIDKKKEKEKEKE